MDPLSASHVAFGATVRTIRKERGISQEALALQCGMDRSYFGAVERGERNVSLTNMLRIAASLGVPAAQILARAHL
jgi:transcriptional regulator with XRE-family HTH domain